MYNRLPTVVLKMSPRSFLDNFPPTHVFILFGFVFPGYDWERYHLNTPCIDNQQHQQLRTLCVFPPLCDIPHVCGVTPCLSLVSTQVRHIFCVKPNDELSASYLDGTGLLRQLSAAGVAAAAKTGILSLPTGRRVDKEEFFQDFRVVPGAIQR